MNSTDPKGRRDRHDEEHGGSRNTGRTRSHCLRLLTVHLGEGGMRMFLRQPQPDLGNRTGAELLESDPDDLLHRLKAIVENNPCQS